MSEEMTSKELFSNFIKETIGYPYFSTLYDLDMWTEDKERIENDLEVLEIIKKHKTALEATNENGEIAFVDYSFSINHDDEDYEKVKRWLEGK